jgi:hypothetical protein
VEILISANFTPTLGSQIAEPGTIEWTIMSAFQGWKKPTTDLSELQTSLEAGSKLKNHI